MNFDTPAEREAYWAEQDAKYEVERAHRFRNGFWVNVYDYSRAYGGPEEGGWWVDTGEPIESHVFNLERNAEAKLAHLREEYPSTGRASSVNGGDDYIVRIEPHKGRAFPKEWPHYE